MNLRKTYFILPNLFTISGIFCGFFSITLAASGENSEQLYQAALAICFGYFFDTFDGRVARLTKTQSQLGMELDSLSDVITFGVAPAMLVYKWGLSSFGLWGVVIAFLYVAAGASHFASASCILRRVSASSTSACRSSYTFSGVAVFCAMARAAPVSSKARALKCW